MSVSAAIAEPPSEVNTGKGGQSQITYQQAHANFCAHLLILVSQPPMGETRIDQALARIEAAMARIDSAQAAAKKRAKTSSDREAEAGSARVMALVNSHEKLREEVADTLRDLDALIEELES